MNGRLGGVVIAAAAVLSATVTEAFVLFLPADVQAPRRQAPAAVLQASMSSVEDTMATLGKAVAIAALSLAVFDPSPAFADGQTDKFKLPPVDLKDKARCQFQDSKMGQANAQRDKVRPTLPEVSFLTFQHLCCVRHVCLGILETCHSGHVILISRSLRLCSLQ